MCATYKLDVYYYESGRTQKKSAGHWARILNKGEQAHDTTQKECLAFVWSETFLRTHLEGTRLSVRTDQHSLRQILISDRCNKKTCTVVNPSISILPWRRTPSRHQTSSSPSAVTTIHRESGQHTTGRWAPSVYSWIGRHINWWWKQHVCPEIWRHYTTTTHHPSEWKNLAAPSSEIFVKTYAADSFC